MLLLLLLLLLLLCLQNYEWLPLFQSCLSACLSVGGSLVGGSLVGGSQSVLYGRKHAAPLSFFGCAGFPEAKQTRK